MTRISVTLAAATMTISLANSAPVASDRSLSPAAVKVIAALTRTAARA